MIFLHLQGDSLINVIISIKSWCLILFCIGILHNNGTSLVEDEHYIKGYTKI